MTVPNEDQRKRDYAETDTCPRPGHAEYTYLHKSAALRRRRVHPPPAFWD